MRMYSEKLTVRRAKNIAVQHGYVPRVEVGATVARWVGQVRRRFEHLDPMSRGAVDRALAAVDALAHGKDPEEFFIDGDLFYEGLSRKERGTLDALRRSMVRRS